MVRKRIILLTLPLIFLLASCHAKTSSGNEAQHLFQRHDESAADGGRPNIEFATSPDAAPVLVKSNYDQFAAAPGRDADADRPAAHHKHKHGKKKEHGVEEVSEKRLLRWMHRLGLHPDKHQVERLSGWIDGKQGRGRHHRHGERHQGGHRQHHHQKDRHHEGQKHNGEHHHGKHHGNGHHHGAHNQSQKDHSPEKGNPNPPAWTEVNGPKQGTPAPARNIGILPPGTKPLGWGNEASPLPATPPTSPAAAAVAPLPEPVNSAPARTASSPSSPSTPLPGNPLVPPPHPDSAAPVTPLPNTSDPSTSSSRLGIGTSGSLNPSSTPAPPPANEGSGDKRLTPLAANSTGQVVGIPTADDGDAKGVKPKMGTSGATTRREGLEWGGWSTNAMVAGVTLVILLLVAV